MRNYFRILLLSLVAVHTHAQISGTISDARSKKPLTDVEVFIQGKTLSALSNADGEFSLEAPRPGFADLVLYKKGYQLFKSSIRIETGKAYTLNLSMEVSRKEKGLSPSTENHTAEVLQFKESLFGKDHAVDFTILNESALSWVRKDEVLYLRTQEPIAIDNRMLGYQLRYYLQQCSFANNSIQLQGYFTFLPLQAEGSEQVIQWSANRLKIYEGSLLHLLKAMAAGTAGQEGFDLLNKNGELLSLTALVAASVPNYHKILLEDIITVRYKGQSTSISQLIPKGSLQINDEGILLIPQNLEVSGPMANQSMPSLLPSDYVPVIPEKEDFMKFYEKIYVQTDKPYYYPGEPLWFKGYVNYFSPAWRDSLSKVVYVEIIHPGKKVILSRTLRLDSGVFYGDFVLPDTLSAGGYFLRAYTQLSRNYGDDNLFMKSIPVLNMTDKADPAQAITERTDPSGVSIITDKPSYKTREKITMSVQLKDKNGKPLAASLSISVTDAVQVVPVPEPKTILNDYPIDLSRIFNNVEFKYPVEFGFGYAGRFLNDKGRPEKTSLSILRLSPRSVFFADTNEEGYFTQTGLNIYDTATFAFKSDKAKERPYGKVQILPHENPPLNFNGSANPISILKTGTAQRLISEYEVPKDTKLLQSVEVKASRLPRDESDQPDYRVKRPYGKPDYTLEAKNINTSYGNLLYAMQGRFPGLVVRQVEGGWLVYTQRATANSISSPTGILVTINDVAMGGNAADILSSINPNTVESIEVTTRVNVLYGSAGANGVISIHTKQGIPDDEPKLQNFQILVLHGYSRTRSFSHPQYNDPNIDRTKADYRATLYWNPFVTTKANSGTANVSFFSSDLPGRYRVVVEGVDGAGEPVRGVYYVEVESD